MARLAFVSPLPPSPTGVADYAADVLCALAGRHAIEAFAEGDVDRARLPKEVAVHPAAELPARHQSEPYDLAIHQMGNSRAHAFVYPLLARVPGLLVLHDLVLHHARAAEFLDGAVVRAYAAAPWRRDLRAGATEAIGAYTAEVGAGYPAAAERLADAQLNTVGDLLAYAYPLFHPPAAASRAVAVHNGAMADAVREAFPSIPVAILRMPAARVAVSPDAARDLRARLGIAPEDFVVACLGLVTREKRIETVARAVARAVPDIPRIRLLLVGPVDDPPGLDAALDRAGARGRTIVAGRVPLDELPAYLEAADVVAHLRWPTARETSAALLRALAQGRPTVMADLENLAEIPSDAVLRVDVSDEEGDLARALLHLAARPDLRDALGRRAAAFVAEQHSPSAAADSYEAAILLAAATAPVPHDARARPVHWPPPLLTPAQRA